MCFNSLSFFSCSFFSLSFAISSFSFSLRFISFTSKIEDVATCDIYIITVPTPVDANNEPDLSALESASLLVGKLLCKGNTVIYESTVYPGCTEEVCLPILEKESKMELGQFYLGYSPERINPADKTHTLQNTVKVVSGHSNEALQKIAKKQLKERQEPEL